jgi:glycosyltransferase involved in cell wall biosynthesis
MNPSVSVIMINRNGGEWLKNSLRSCRESFDANRLRNVDLLVIDNGSTDGSLLTIHNELNTADFKFSVISEPKAGVNFARNAGIRHSQSDYLIFTDNDLEFSPNWLLAYLEGFKNHPDCSAFAGRVLVGKIEGALPSWLDLDGPFSWPSIVVRCDNGEDDLESVVGDLKLHGPVGPNMAFRRDLFDDVGLFDTNFGLRPGSLVAGAEAEFFHRLDGKEKFAYLAQATVWHPLKKNQIDKTYFLRRLEGTGRVLSRAQWKSGLSAKSFFGIKRYLFREYFNELVSWLIACLKGCPLRRFHARCRLAVVIGKIKEDWNVTAQKS